jgi:PIN domain nuclease of toxin-antitoxin system
MKLLLDTQVLIWYDSEPHKLSAAASVAIRDPANEALFSAASIWELAIKSRLGKLTVPRPLAELVQMQQTYRIAELPVQSRHSLGTEALPLIHKDPFDRLLISQAIVESATLVTADPTIRSYAVATLW